MNNLRSSVLAAGCISLFFLSTTELTRCEPRDGVVTICEVMADPGAFHNQIVALRARVRRSTEGGGLVHPKPCTKPPRSDLQIWLPTVTVGTLDWFEKETGTRPFEKTESDVAAQAKYSKLFRTLKPGEAVEATFVGLIRTRERYEVRQLSNGRWVPANGFGHLGAYFAELTIKARRDVRIVSADQDDAKD